jgi:hypothetical protein
MESIDVKQLLRKISDLHSEINSWGSTNSQSNPGAVMYLRWMKKEVQKLENELGSIRLKQKTDNTNK